MDIVKIPTTTFPAFSRLISYLFHRKEKQRHVTETASRLVSVLDRYVTDCTSAAGDNGFDPRSNPEYYDYRKRKIHCQDPVLALPDLPGWEL